MRFFVIAFAVIAAARAASVPSDYLPPVVDNNLPSQEYLPPAAPGEPQTALADDGYRYKTVRRLKYRHRRDVNELPAGEYLPPTAVAAHEEAVVVEAPAEESAALGNDGYRYKTVRRLKYRHRRDVNELPAGEYLPPAEEVTDNSIAVAAPAEEQTVLANDGYRYKVVRRLRYRHRRDVNELPAGEYLPPTAVAAHEEAVVVEAPAEESAALANDGYRYKTVRRLKYRHRRDVNELPAGEYLPPTAVAAHEEAVVVEAPAEESAALANDGYRYKTVRRLKYRHRRDVNELPAGEYLPPTAVAAHEEAVVVEAPAEESAALANDGYRYKTVRRLKYRHRRDVNELPAGEYLPPTAVAAHEEAVVVEAPAEESAALANDGYRYKTVRRLKYRHRRDVNELPAGEYLPPTAVAAHEEAVVVEAPAEESAALANDGYRYKTVRRIRYRHRRDVSELPAGEYLPPAVAVTENAVVDVPVQEQTVLAADGYRYKTVRRLKYRRH